jgi:murein DD-endopeptidase MepM/ murein hydrolase activator NlpD
MKIKQLPQLVIIVMIIFSGFPGRVEARPESAPPADMFQLPWEQGQSWVAFDGFDAGKRRLPTSPHNFKLGGAVDFAPLVNMFIGMDTSNFWVTAAAAGMVTTVSTCHVIIDHGNGWTTEYWHLANIQVLAGEAVYRNQRLAVIADNKDQQVCTGNEHPGPHLHFVMRPKMVETKFAGWTIKYDEDTNKTTFSKGGQTVGLFEPLLNVPGLQIVSRGQVAFDTNYSGSVDAYRYERWTLQLTESTTFNITASPSKPGLIPLIVLLNSGGTEITRSNSGVLNTTQPAGSYFIQIQPEAGNGFYNMILHKDTSGGATSTPTPTNTATATQTATATPTATSTTGVNTPTHTLTPPIGPTNTLTSTATQTATNTPTIGVNTSTPTTTATPTATGTILPTGPYVRTDIPQASLNVGETGLVTVSLNNVPAEGFTSAEFTCSYNPGIVEVNNIVLAGLFGTDIVSAVNGPQNGLFILAVAGSNGNKATTSGPVFTFNARGLQPGQTNIECTARVSIGLGTLESIQFIGDNVTIIAVATATATSPTTALLTGTVLASKPVTVRLYNAQSVIVATTTTGAGGSFGLQVPGGNYTIVAQVEGHLNAQGSITLVNGVNKTMQTVTLIPGDVDGNSTINQLDALSIGMNYNASTPTSADLNNDGTINLLDLQLLAAHFGQSGALNWQ